MGEDSQLMVRALGHPLRLEILRMLEEGPSSPKRLSDRMEEKLGNVSYHMKVLLGCGSVALVESIPRRGAVEHIYQLTGAIGRRTWNEVPPSLRTDFAGTALAEFTKRAVEAMDAGTVKSREGSGLISLPLNVDEQGWKELRCVIRSVEARFRAVAKKCAERMENQRGGIPVIVALAAFEIASGEDDGPSGGRA
jgi:DNA-binding transcriptional ArsR family regulator